MRKKNRVQDRTDSAADAPREDHRGRRLVGDALARHAEDHAAKGEQVIDGLSATRAIRMDLGLKDLPVIALTAGVLPKQREQAQEAGCNDFLGKPDDHEELVAMLARFTHRAQHKSGPEFKLG